MAPVDKQRVHLWSLDQYTTHTLFFPCEFGTMLADMLRSKDQFTADMFLKCFWCTSETGIIKISIFWKFQFTPAMFAACKKRLHLLPHCLEEPILQCCTFYLSLSFAFSATFTGALHCSCYWGGKKGRPSNEKIHDTFFFTVIMFHNFFLKWLKPLMKLGLLNLLLLHCLSTKDSVHPHTPPLLNVTRLSPLAKLI